MKLKAGSQAGVPEAEVPSMESLLFKAKRVWPFPVKGVTHHGVTPKSKVHPYLMRPACFKLGFYKSKISKTFPHRIARGSCFPVRDHGPFLPLHRMPPQGSINYPRFRLQVSLHESKVNPLYCTRLDLRGKPEMGSIVFSSYKQSRGIFI